MDQVDCVYWVVDRMVWEVPLLLLLRMIEVVGIVGFVGFVEVVGIDAFH